MDCLWSTLLPLSMLASLLSTLTISTFSILLALPDALWRGLRAQTGAAAAHCTFYEGTVFHVRRAPVHNSFRYPVRVAVVDLDNPPDWWRESASEHWTAAQAREIAGTDGAVKLLTNPTTAGYTQNPISIFYCCAQNGTLSKCIAVVTNTPWAARVSFLFDPSGESVPKALHVSPFMDMQGTWHLQAPLPDAHLHLSVAVSHPEHGNFFNAVLTGQVSDAPCSANEHAGWQKLFRYGFQPQRVALLIYWQALRLLWKGVPFYSPPDSKYRDRVNQMSTNEADKTGQKFSWVGAQRFPWNVQQ